MEKEETREVTLDFSIKSTAGTVVVRGNVILSNVNGTFCVDASKVNLTMISDEIPQNLTREQICILYAVDDDYHVIDSVMHIVKTTALALAEIRGFDFCSKTHFGFDIADLICVDNELYHKSLCVRGRDINNESAWFLREDCTQVYYRNLEGERFFDYLPNTLIETLEYCESCSSYVPSYQMYLHGCCSRCHDREEMLITHKIQGYTASHDSTVILFDSSRKADEAGHYKGNKENFVGLGFELEVDTKTDEGLDNQETVDSLMCSCGLEADAMRFANDGSLNYGFECISQPHTVEAFWEKTDKWRNMLNYLAESGYSSHDVGTCGLHVHVSRGMFGKTKEEQDSAIAKVFVFFDENWNDLVKASRRTNFTYCEQNRLRWEDSESSYNKKYGKYFAWKKSSKTGNARGHYVALNNANRNTFEFRLGRGTLNSWSFFSWIDLVITIASNAKRITVNKVVSNDTVSWLSGIKESTARYLYKRRAFRDVVLALYPSIAWEGDLTDC